MITIDHIYRKVEGLITKEAINQAIAGDTVDEWQKVSYPVITKQFENLSGKHSKKAWIKRIAYTYSWHPHTPNYEVSPLIKENFQVLEDKFSKADLRKVKLIENEEEKAVRYKKKQHELSDFIIPIGTILYGKEEMDYQLSAVSKVMHFMFPHLFPLFDRKACETLFGSNYQSYSRYYRYMSALKTYLEEGEHTDYIVKRANKEGVSPLYVMEMALHS